MQAATAATSSRLIRAGVGAIPVMADPTRGASNLEWRPGAGNLSKARG